MLIEPIATIKNDYENKFAVPRQSGIVAITSTIHFTAPYAKKEAVKELDGFSHLWLIWGFSENIREEHSLTVRPPRLGGNQRVGVFASRSPFRPNNLGLSSVRLERISYDEHGCPILTVSGADLIDGTPIYDIKPYLPFTDAHPEARAGYLNEHAFPLLEVSIPKEIGAPLSKEQLAILKELLRNDPRPAYQENEQRIYGFYYGGYEIRFTVKENLLEVTDIHERSTTDNPASP